MGALGQLEQAAGPFAKSIARRLTHPDRIMRCYALETLGNMGNVAMPFAAKVVRVMQNSDSAEERTIAVSAIGKMGEKAAAKFSQEVAELLEDGDANVRERAVEA